MNATRPLIPIAPGYSISDEYGYAINLIHHCDFKWKPEVPFCFIGFYYKSNEELYIVKKSAGLRISCNHIPSKEIIDKFTFISKGFYGHI